MKNFSKTLILAVIAMIVSACSDGNQVLNKADATFKNAQTSVKSYKCTLSSWDNYLLEDDTCTDSSGVCTVKNVPIGKWNLLCTPTAASTKVALMNVDKVIDVKPEDVSSNEWELDFEKGAVVVIGNADGGPPADTSPKPDGELPDQKVPDQKVPDQKVPDQKVPDQKVDPDSTVTKPDTGGISPDTGTTTTGKGSLSPSAVSGGVLVAASCTATMGSYSSSGTTTTSSTSPLVLSGLPVGMWKVVCTYSGSSKTVYVTVTENATTKLQMSLGGFSGTCTASTLLQKADVTIASGGSKNLAGTFQYCDSSGCKQIVPDSQLVLTVSSGSSVTVSGLIVNATSTTGGSYLQYCWTAPIWGGGSTCKTFYAYVY